MKGIIMAASVNIFTFLRLSQKIAKRSNSYFSFAHESLTNATLHKVTQIKFGICGLLTRDYVPQGNLLLRHTSIFKNVSKETFSFTFKIETGTMLFLLLKARIPIFQLSSVLISVTALATPILSMWIFIVSFY
jgi:adenosine/AMP kinase